MSMNTPPPGPPTIRLVSSSDSDPEDKSTTKTQAKNSLSFSSSGSYSSNWPSDTTAASEIPTTPISSRIDAQGVRHPDLVETDKKDNSETKTSTKVTTTTSTPDPETEFEPPEQVGRYNSFPLPEPVLSCRAQTAPAALASQRSLIASTHRGLLKTGNKILSKMGNHRSFAPSTLAGAAPFYPSPAAHPKDNAKHTKTKPAKTTKTTKTPSLMPRTPAGPLPPPAHRGSKTIAHSIGLKGLARPPIIRRAKDLPIAPKAQLIPEVASLPFNSTVPAAGVSALLKLADFVPVLPHVPYLVANLQRERRLHGDISVPKTKAVVAGPVTGAGSGAVAGAGTVERGEGTGTGTRTAVGPGVEVEVEVGTEVPVVSRRTTARSTGSGASTLSSLARSAMIAVRRPKNGRARQGYLQLRHILERSPSGNRLIAILISLYGPLCAGGLLKRQVVGECQEWVVEVVMEMFSLFKPAREEVPRRKDVRDVVGIVWPLLQEYEGLYRRVRAKGWEVEKGAACANFGCAPQDGEGGQGGAGGCVYGGGNNVLGCEGGGDRNLPDPRVIARGFCALFLVETWRRRPDGLVSTGEWINGLLLEKSHVFASSKEVYVLVGALGAMWLWRWTTLVLGLKAELHTGRRVDMEKLDRCQVVFVLPGRNGDGDGEVVCDDREGLLATVRTIWDPLKGLSVWDKFFGWKGYEAWAILGGLGGGGMGNGDGTWGGGVESLKDGDDRVGEKRQDEGVDDSGVVTEALDNNGLATENTKRGKVAAETAVRAGRQDEAPQVEPAGRDTIC